MIDHASRPWQMPGDYTTYLGIDPEMEDVEVFAKRGHYVVIVFEPDVGQPGGKAFGMIPMMMGEFTVPQLRQMLAKFRAKPKEAKAFLRLYAADLAAFEAGLYTPVPPARYIVMYATGPIPFRAVSA